MLLHPTPSIPGESARTRTLYVIATALVAAAIGSGSPDTPADARLPGWVDVLANVVCAGLEVLVLVPRTRAMACVVTAVVMVASMVTNYMVDGLDFFLQALAFNLLTLGLALWVAFRHLRPHAGP